MRKGLQLVVVTVYLATFLLVTGITVLAVHGVFAGNLPQVSIDSAADSVTVVPTGVTCTNDSTVITDVMPKNGAILAPGQSFDQVWRVQNNGTCAWGSGYQIGFMGGSRLGAPAVMDVPMTLSRSSVDLQVTMKAPAQPGEYTGHWQLRSPGGTVFGADLEVTIRVRAQRPGGCSGNPLISSFSADPMTIIAGQSSTLMWGLVSNADFATVAPGIGGIATPGSQSVSPPATTIYTLTARCGSHTTTAQVTITVLP